jgi:hypothetical protein
MVGIANDDTKFAIAEARARTKYLSASRCRCNRVASKQQDQLITASHLDEDGALGLGGRWWGERALGRGEDAEVDEPGTRVELRVDGLDEPLLRRLGVGVLDGLEDDDAGDLLGLLAGALGKPAEGYGVAVVPGFQDLEGNSGLSTLARLERSTGVEDCRAERDSLVGGAGTVDQFDDRVGVVDKVDGQSLVGEGIAVGRDEGLEVCGDLRGVGVAHAVGGGTLGSPGRGGYGCSERNSCEGENGTHVGCRRMVVVGCKAR